MLPDDLYERICDLPIIDVHSHLHRDRMAARELRDVVFYHMLLYPLRAAGMAEQTLWPGGREGSHDPARVYAESMPCWRSVASTSFGWALRTILRELYEFDEPIAAESLPRLRDKFDAKVAQPDWEQSVLARANVRRILSSRIDVEPLAPGEPDPGVRFTIEAAPSSGIREFDTWPQRLRHLNELAGKPVATLADLQSVLTAFYDRFEWSEKHALVSWVSSQAEFRPVASSAIDGLLADAQAGRDVGADGARLLEAALIRCTCQAIRDKTGVFQICYGTQFVTPGALHPVTRSAGAFASGLAHLAGEFPEIHFNLLSGHEPDEPALCSLCLAYANVSLGGYWWNNFYPSVMRAAWHRRLDMVPTSRLCGFFSDGYCVDWIYARIRMTQRVLANVLAEKVEQGFYTPDQAVGVAREILFETPRRLFLADEGIDG